MLIYLDNCCYNRPFDDQMQNKVVLETEAIFAILEMCKKRKDWIIVGSDVVIDEMSENNNPLKRQKVFLLYRSASIHIDLDDEIVMRAKEFGMFGVEPFDAMHLASAERANANVLLTTDVKFIKKAKRTNAKVRVENPLIWILEVMNVG